MRLERRLKDLKLNVSRNSTPEKVTRRKNSEVRVIPDFPHAKGYCA